MTRMVSGTTAMIRGALALAVGGFVMTAVGCESSTTEPPANQTMDLSNVPPPEAMPTPAPAPAPAPITPPISDAPSTPSATPATPSQRTHTIAKGDTIYNLAAKYYGSGNKANQDKILAANPGLQPTKMSIGKTIVIP